MRKPEKPATELTPKALDAMFTTLFLSVPIAGVAFFVTRMIAPSLRLTGPFACPDGTIRTSIRYTDRVDNSRGSPKTYTSGALVCHDAGGHETALEGWASVKADLILALYAFVIVVIAVAVTLRIRRSRRAAVDPH